MNPIRVEYDPKPIPARQFDYSATFDGYEPGDLIGYGSTAESAIEDLQEQAELDSDELTGTNKQFGVGA